MKRISDYIDSLYEGIDETNQEIIDLKAEMKSHLLEAVAELQAKGFSEQESVEIAIERFGNKEYLRAELLAMYRFQRKFVKYLFRAAMIFLAVGICVISFFGFFGNMFNDHLHDMYSKVFQTLGDDETISLQKRGQLEEIIRQYPYGFKYIALFPITDTAANTIPQPLDNASFVYPENVTPSSIGQVSGRWGEHWMIQYQIFLPFPYIYGVLFGILFLICYWLLFAIWAMVSAYQEKKLNAGWALAFCLLNILGYLPFRFMKRV